MAQGKLLKPTDKDRSLVESLSGYGLPFAQIAAITCGGIDEETLNKHFKKELVQGKAKANSKVGQTLFQKATGGDTTAMIWWSKTQMGWKETKEVEVVDKTSERKFIIERATRDDNNT
jgi:hypothetical protein